MKKRRDVLNYSPKIIFRLTTFRLQLEFAVAIDFTASNGPVHDPDSLHYFGGRGYPNQ
jgi:hypothetical protein